jgi:ABC-type molybdate transport system substrate-binding protein
MRKVQQMYFAAMAYALLVFSSQAETIKVVAAGSLKSAFVEMASNYKKLSPSSEIEFEWGPAGYLSGQLKKGEPFDVFASAAAIHAEALTEAGLSSPTVLFAHNLLCALVPAQSTIKTETIVADMLDSRVKIGTSTPGFDPSGDYTWDLFHKIDRQMPGSFETLSIKAKQLFGSPNKKGMDPLKDPILGPIDERQVDMIIIYCSGAREIDAQAPEQYRKVDFPGDLQMGADYGLTISNKASLAAADFVMFILSAAGQDLLRKNGFIPAIPPALK